MDAFLICSDNISSINETLFSYRKYYPDMRILTLNKVQCQTDYTLLNMKYKCEDVSLVDTCYRPIDQLLKSIGKLQGDWVIFLTDEVLVVNYVNIAALKYDVNILECNRKLPSYDYLYGSINGAILRTKFFRDLSKEDNIEDVMKICDEKSYCIDIIISLLTYLYGGTIGTNSQIAQFQNSKLNLETAKSITNKEISVLNNYNILHNMKPHPYLFSLKSDKYTLVLPTRGSGSQFEIFLEQLLPRYFIYLNFDEIEEFIIICPQNNLDATRSKILECFENAGIKTNIIFRSDESIANIKINGWIKQQIIKLEICSYVKTEHYFIIDDDLIMTKSLKFSDLVDKMGHIDYWYESWNDSINVSYTSRWWYSSLALSRMDENSLVNMSHLMAVTPQLMLTHIVYQLVQSLGTRWMERMAISQSTEFCLYWVYLIKTSRTYYYNPSLKLFANDNDVNIFRQGLNRREFIQKIRKGLIEKKYIFLVAQSWLNYPKEWIIAALQ